MSRGPRPALLLLSIALPLAILAANLLACGTQAPPSATGDPERCASCHLDEFQSAKHHVGERPPTCGVCHLQSAWRPSRLEHPFWELTGAHEKAKCFGCHQGTPPTLKGTKKECVSCHKAEYEKAPDHVLRFPTTCEECHTTSGWKPTLPEPDRRAPAASAVTIPVPAASSSLPTTTTPKPKPRPRPGPAPSAAPSAAPSTQPPDTVSGPSKRRH